MSDYRFLTFNAWALPATRRKDERLHALARALPPFGADVIALQEMWMEEDRDVLMGRLDGTSLRYAHSFPAGVAGSGMMLLSPHPIIETGFYRFRLTSHPLRENQNEYLSGKGVGYVRLDTPRGDLLAFTVHPLAQHWKFERDDTYPYHRDAALYETARFVHQVAGNTPAVLLGDFNSEPHQMRYRALMTLGLLTDAWAALRPQDPGYTWATGNPYNSDGNDQRLDYVCLRPGLTPTHCQMVLKQDGDGEFYSDHYGILTDADCTAADVPAGADVPAVLDALAASFTAGLNDVGMRLMTLVADGALELSVESVMNLQYADPIPRARLMGQFFLLEERTALQALLDEVNLQRSVRRAFNGVRW